MTDREPVRVTRRTTTTTTTKPNGEVVTVTATEVVNDYVGAEIASPAGEKNGGSSTSDAQAQKPWGKLYPAARRDESVVDSYHGTDVADPYRWLEDPDAPETAAFVEEQNKLSAPYLDTPVKAQFRDRMRDLFNFPKFRCPFKRGERFFYYHNKGLQNQSVLYVQDSLEGEPRVFLDPNGLSDDGTTALSSTSFSEDGSLMAYALSRAGSDWNTVRVRRVEEGTDTDDVLEWVKFSCLSWTHDGRGFFYNRYDAPKEAESLDAGTETDTNVFQKLYYHVLGQPQSEDLLIYEMPEHAQWMCGAEVTDDGAYIVLTVSEGCDPVNRLLVAPVPVSGIVAGMEFTSIVDNFDAQYECIANDDTVFTFKTNLSAPRYKLIRADLALVLAGTAEVAWTDVVPEGEDVLKWATPINNDGLVVAYLRDVKSVLELRSLGTGQLERELPLPIGTVTGFSGRRKDSFMFYKFVSMLTPGTIYHCDLAAGASAEPTVFRQVEVPGFDASQFQCKQVFYPSKDGTSIPMFLMSRKDVELDGSNVTLLYGYGGFNISITPSFSVSRIIFCKHMRGIVAVANLRGGGEYGEKWHKAGSLGQKQNVFDDFQSAAEYLVDNGYTKPERIAIQGGSNGGLLVAACANQRPDLFGCVLAHVGVMDMLRFHRFTIGHAWKTDFGCADVPEEFKWLFPYSPLHNVRPGRAQHPAMLLLTGDHDDRVVPLHTLKLIATLQYELGCRAWQTNPLLARIECKAGHGAGKPTEKVIEETADQYAFIARSTGAAWHA